MTQTKPRWAVRIVEYDTDKVVKETIVHSERKADKLARGFDINLNHEQFYTEVVEVSTHDGFSE